MARDLTPNERDLLEWLLAEPRIPDAERLRAQVPFAHVVEGVPDLPTYLHLEVQGAPPAHCPDGLVPGEAVVESGDGEAAGFLML